MTDDPERLVLVYLRRLDAGQAAIREDIADVKQRLNELTRLVARQGQDQLGLYETGARADARLDRFEERLTRIERRFDLVE